MNARILTALIAISVVSGTAIGCARNFEDTVTGLVEPERSQTGGILAIACSGRTCATGKKVKLSWAPNPADQQVLGYKIFFGPTEASASDEITDLPITKVGFDPMDPSIEYDAGNQLGLFYGDTVCFRISAYGPRGLSQPSHAICVRINR